MSTWPGGEKDSLPESRQAFEVTATRISGLVNLVFSRQTGFFNASIHLLIKLLVITEPAVLRAWLLGLDWRLYPSNMHHSIHAVFLEYTNIDRASERKALLAGWNYLLRLVESIFRHPLNWARTTATIQIIIENTQAGRWNFKYIKNTHSINNYELYLFFLPVRYLVWRKLCKICIYIRRS